MIGSTLGHYRIAAKLGEGGMGAVYRATDTRLQRDVAIKVLLPQVAADPERLLRFEREARVLANLNHPGIAAVYGFERDAETPFLAMEYVAGSTLDELTGKLDEADIERYALQMAEAIAAAHEKSIIHRDLKPANVKVTMSVPVDTAGGFKPGTPKMLFQAAENWVEELKQKVRP